MLKRMLAIAVLAAGKGTRMKSALPKVLQPLAGSTLVERVLSSARTLKPERRLLIVGHSPNDSHASQHPAQNRMFGPEPVVAAAGDGFEVIHAEHRTRTTPDGDERIDTVVVLQRR